ncbi:MAG: hypothetical protein ACNS62_10960, partial [Candidatus Cyclobacteriaceae bacterium M3_2C_046]
ALNELVVKNMANYPLGHILELPKNTILYNIKAKLNALGISNFNDVGDVKLTYDLNINKPGIAGPSNFINNIIPKLRKFDPNLVPNNVGPSFANKELLHVRSNPIWLQTESVIIADELNLK